MSIQADEKERCAVGVHVSNESAIVYIPADVSNRHKGYRDVRGVVYGQEEAGENLGYQAEA